MLVGARSLRPASADSASASGHEQSPRFAPGSGSDAWSTSDGPPQVGQGERSGFHDRYTGGKLGLVDV